MIKFEVEGEVVPKGRPRFTRTGHTYTPIKTVVYEQRVKHAARKAMGDLEPFDEQIQLEIRIGMPVPKSWSKKKQLEALTKPHTKKPDLDNLVKAILDGMNGVAYRDDSLIYKFSAYKAYALEPSVEVTIYTARELEALMLGGDQDAKGS